MVLEAKFILRFTKLENKSPTIASVPTTAPTFHDKPMIGATADVITIARTSPRIVFEGPNKGRPSKNLIPPSHGQAIKSPKTLFAITGIPFANVNNAKHCRIIMGCILASTPLGQFD